MTNHSTGPVGQAHHLFRPAGVYLNTATAGLPPEPTWQALQATWARYRDGSAQAPDFDAAIEAARAAYARLAGAPVEQVAVGSQASVFFGMVAAALPSDARIVVASNEFTSVTFPFAAHGHTLVQVPLAQVADAIAPGTTAVAVAAVQSADGAVADLPAIAEACARTGALSLIDTTQSLGWLPTTATDFDVTVTSGYKWLLAPRGTAFMTIRPDLMERVRPVAAGWYAGDDRWSSIYGLPLRLATSARRFDVSPAWHSWVGAAPSLELLANYGAPALHEHSVGLARAFRAGVGLPDGDSAIVSVDLLPGADERVRQAGIVGAMRDGRLRLSFHLNNSAADVAAAVAALSGFVATPRSESAPGEPDKSAEPG